MAGHITWLPTFGSHCEKMAENKSRTRPLPLRLRTYSTGGFQSPGSDDNRDGGRTRHKSVSAAANVAEMSPRTIREMGDEDEDLGEMHDVIGEFESPRTSIDGSTSGMSDIFSLAGGLSTPLTSLSSERSSLDMDAQGVMTYDFSKLDYELDRAKVLGEGLWSTVYLAEQKPTPPARRRGSSLLSTQKSPRLLRKSRATSTPRLLAIKTPARQDARDIFQQEARMLTHLQRRVTASQYIVPFCGLDERNHSLVFEAIIGGSLEGLCGRMKQMTEVARHLELIALFPGIAYDLINGLDFLHTNGVVHADIKPGNILLDVSEHATEQKPVIRARYIDFSAAFMPQTDVATDAGGTWDYMSPEQMRIQPEWNTPTSASDVWSLGITLLYILVGGSPYTAACGGNNFMLREAIKSGDPLQFARMDPVPRKRLAACQDFVDCCRQALKKDRDNRVTANVWVNWLEDWQLDD
ncbi:kinase domain-containing protein [Dothistroma septosporum NZE10]|uniref:Autophagy-related protein 1 n=1 Tax=Dothistroma septosporum (strain NZE10 / CBS 128990) TaxID=675120 RepID=N1PV08_DOTSN|nr:kinase domain-containing protein [Dothistroma septosporum NZE10]